MGRIYVSMPHFEIPGVDLGALRALDPSENERTRLNPESNPLPRTPAR